MVSFPHFYQADPKYINAIDGLSPNKEEHETYLDLEPVWFNDSNPNVKTTRKQRSVSRRSPPPSLSDHGSSHSGLQASSAQYHSEESHRLPVSGTARLSPTLPLPHCPRFGHALSQMSSDLPVCLSVCFCSAEIQCSSTRPFSPSCSSMR